MHAGTPPSKRRAALLALLTLLAWPWADPAAGQAAPPDPPEPAPPLQTAPPEATPRVLAPSPADAPPPSAASLIPAASTAGGEPRVLRSVPAMPILQAIEVRSDEEIEEGRLAKLIEVEAGQKLDPALLRRTLSNLHADGGFAQAEALLREGERPTEAVLVLVLRSRPRISRIEYEGQLGLRTRLLRPRQELLVGAPYVPEKLEASKAALAELYRRNGYLGAKVASEVRPAGEHRVEVAYLLDSGPRARVGQVFFSGEHAPFTAEQLREPLRLRQGAKYDPDRLDGERRRLQRFVARQSYLSATVEAPTEVYDATTGVVDVTFPIQLGPKVEVVVHGYELAKLRKRGLLTFYGESPLDEIALEQSRQRIVADLQTRGFYHASVETRLERLDDGQLRAALDVREGEKFRLRELRFEGVEEVEEDELRRLMSISPRKLLQPGSGIVTDAELDADISNLTSYYRLQGFGEAKVGPPIFEIVGQAQPDDGGAKKPVVEAKAEDVPPPALPVEAAPEVEAETRPEAKALPSDTTPPAPPASEAPAPPASEAPAAPTPVPAAPEPAPRKNDPDRVDLVLRLPVEEGHRQRVVDIVLDGVSLFERDELLEKMPLRRGGPFNALLLDDSINVIRALYEEEGYAYTRVEPTLEWNEEGTLVDVLLSLEEGPQLLVDRLILRGQVRTDKSLITRTADLPSGSVLSRRRLVRAQRDLYRLGIFSRVDVKLAPATTSSTTRDILIEVQESTLWRVSYGFSYHSEDGIGGLFSLSRLNLNGDAGRLQVDLRGSQNDRRARLVYDRPFLGDARLPLTFALYLREEQHPSFDVREKGGQISLTRDLDDLRLSLLYDYRLVDLTTDPENPPDDPIDRLDTDVEISSITPDLLYDRRDDPLDPTRGYSTDLRLEWAHPLFEADADFLKLFLQQTAYLQLGSRLGVLAGSVRVGAIEPFAPAGELDPELPPGLPSAQVPISERFFAGGRTSHRAFARDALGLLGETLLPEADGSPHEVGGNGLLLVNLDWRFPVTESFGGVIFLDIGNVWADWRDVDGGALRYGAGIGVRYKSPIGPVRAELGWKLDPEPWESSSPVFFLSLGNPF